MSTYSNWREDLIEVIDTPTTEKKAEKKVKESKVNNKVVINPTFKEAVAEMGGQILEVAEVDDKKGTEEDPQIKSKQKRQGMLKRQVLLKKLQAVRSGGGADITAGYEPQGEMVEGIGKSIKKGVRIAKRVAKDATSPYDPGGYTTIGSLGNPHLGNEEKRAKERAAKKKVDEGVALDAYNKITNKEKRDKIKKELDTLTKRAKAMKKHGSGYHPFLHGEEVEKVDEGIMKMVKKVIRSKKPAKKATMDPTTDKLHDWRQKNSDEQKEREKYVSPFRPIVKEADDKAYKYVVSKLKKQYGDGVLTKGDKIKPLTPEQKKKNAEIMAKRAKQDGRDATEKASDGRYSDRYSNRGSD